jgi:hypothetical protein
MASAVDERAKNGIGAVALSRVPPSSRTVRRTSEGELTITAMTSAQKTTERTSTTLNICVPVRQLGEIGT